MKTEELKSLMELCKKAPKCMITVGCDGVEILLHDKKAFDEIIRGHKIGTEVFKGTVFTKCEIDGVLYEMATRHG